MSLLQTSKTSAVVAAAIFFAAPTTYLCVESYATKMYSPYYSYKEHATSNLGVPYSYMDPETGTLIKSGGAKPMRINFVANGFLYLAGHICLLSATAGKTNGKLYTARLVVAAIYCLGINLVAGIPGGPEERANRTVRWHGFGALLAIGGGNLNSILAGMATSANLQPIYRISSMLLGVTGLAAIPLTFKFATATTRGLWQRSSIYPIQGWAFMTATTLALDLL